MDGLELATWPRLLGSVGLGLAAAFTVLIFVLAVDHLRVRQRASSRLARYGLLAPAGELATTSELSPVSVQLVRRLGVGLAKRAGEKRLQQLQDALVQAGVRERLTAEEFLGLRVVAVLLGAGLGSVVAVAVSSALRLPLAPLLVGFVAGLGAIGFALPNTVLTRLARRRRAAVERALPGSLDILIVTLEAGVAFDSAVGFICERTDNPFVSELRRYLADLALGRSRRDALEAMVFRTQSQPIREFAAAVVQAEELGTGMARSLRAHNRAIRAARRVRAEELARTAPVKLMFPLVLCIMPVLFIVIIGPAVLRALTMFGGR